MTNETIISAAAENLTIPLGSLTTVIQALGGIIILYLIFSVTNFVINWKKNKEIKRIGKDVEDIKKMLSKERKKK